MYRVLEALAAIEMSSFRRFRQVGSAFSSGGLPLAGHIQSVRKMREGSHLESCRCSGALLIL